jgi:CheY-like chemotaxis protein
MLDLKLPQCRGLDVLHWARGNPVLRPIAFVVLTSSAERRDLARADELGARFYLVKPPRPETLAETLTVLRVEWGEMPHVRRGVADDLLRGLAPARVPPPAV